MRISPTLRRAFAVVAVIATAGAGLAALPAPAVESSTTAEPAQPSQAAPPAQSAELSVADVKLLFAGQCSWCHGAYGMKADKGPMLVGTSMTEKQVFDRIKNGKSGAMPSFKKALSDDEIMAIAKFIKALKPES